MTRTDNHNHSHEHDHEPGVIEQGSHWASMLAGLLIGSLAGAVAMLLLAPQSGKRTRARLRRQGRALRDQTAETMENVEDAMADARDKTQEMTHDARKQADKLEKRGHALLDG
jgi:gas vesicle protein